MSPAGFLPHELLQLIANFFELHKIPYRVVGSMASTAYGEPRFTNDIDIVAELQAEHSVPLCVAFSEPDYYVSQTAIRDAIFRRSQFNIIHPASGLKADIIVSPNDEFSRSEASRVRRITSPGEYSAWFCSPEDAIIKKLVYYQLSGGVSNKHLGDIAGILKLQGERLNYAYLEFWTDKLGLKTELALATSFRQSNAG
jgi:hypothetical protein